MCETKIDGHAAPLFLSEPVGIDPGQRRDESGLAVVDVAGCTDNEAHRTLLAAASTASISTSSSPLSTVRGSMQHAPPSMRAITGGSPLRSAVAIRDAGPARA